MKTKGFWIMTSLVLIAAVVCSCTPSKNPEHSATEGEMPTLAPPTPTPVPPQSTPTSEPTPTPEHTSHPATGEGAAININLGEEPPTIDPALAMATSSVAIVENIFLGLTTYDDETLEVIPELAEKWEVSSDGLKWTFHLRDDIYWVRYDPTSGLVKKQRPVTAQDVEYGVKRSLDPETGSGYAYLLTIIRNAEAVNTGESVDTDSMGVKALDDYTIEFTLEEPASYFPTITALPVASPVPVESIEEHGDLWTEPGNIWTNGPYLLDTWDHGNQMVMVKNPEHPEADSAQIGKVNWFIIPEADTALAMYQNGELDVTAPPLEDLDRIRQDPVLSEELHVVPVGYTYTYGFNVTKPPVDNVHVRRAMSYAIDRQGLIDTVLKGEQLPASSFARPVITDYPVADTDFKGIVFDPGMAKQELELAGYPDGAGFPEMTLIYETSEGNKQIAEFIQAQWREHLGIEVNLVSQGLVEYTQTVRDDPPHVFQLRWHADYVAPYNWLLEAFRSARGANQIRWANAEYDQLVEQAAFETDAERRKELYFRAEEILCVDKAGIIPIYYYTRVVLTKPYAERTFELLGMEHFYKWKVKAHAVTPIAPPPSPTPTPEEEAIHTLTDPISTPTPTQTPPASEYLEEGMAHYELGKPLLEAHEQTGEGDCREGINQLQLAIEDCTTALDVDPNNANAYFCRGMSRVVLKEDLKEASEDLRRALDLGLESTMKAEAEDRLAEVERILTTPISVSMGDITFAKDWTEDGVPIEAGTTFSGCIGEIWAEWDVFNPGGEEAIVKWSYNGEVVCQHSTGELSGTWTGSGWFPDEGPCIEPGTYWVEVRIGDTELTSGGFEVVE